MASVGPTPGHMRKVDDLNPNYITESIQVNNTLYGHLGRGLLLRAQFDDDLVRTSAILDPSHGYHWPDHGGPLRALTIAPPSPVMTVISICGS